VRGTRDGWETYRRLRAAGVPTTAKTAGGVTGSGDKIAHQIYLESPPRDKATVDSWRNLGNSWFDSVVNSGVLTTTRHAKPDKHRNANHREACEHEAAHQTVAQSFGLVSLANVFPDNSGSCLFEAATPFQTACIALAGQTWINVFRLYKFPCGAKGCEQDLQKVADVYITDGVLIDSVYRYVYLTLRDNQEDLLVIADRLQQDGRYAP
jgi:hypothetical protein